jgi:hypothetical protein
MATKAVKEITSQDVLKYRVTIQFLTRLLGTAPADPKLYADFVVGTALDKALQKARTDEDKARIEQLRAARTEHELSMLPGAVNSVLLEDSPDSVKDALTGGGDIEKGKTVFRANKSGLIVPGYMVKGFYKSAAISLAEFANPTSRIDKWLYVAESEVPLMKDSKQLQRGATEDLPRPLRVEDKFGVSRTCIAVSEALYPPNVQLTYTVLVLPKGFVQKSDSGKFAKGDVLKWTQYGAFMGLGQWRNANNGAFKIVDFEEQPVEWNDALNLRIAALEAA